MRLKSRDEDSGQREVEVSVEGVVVASALIDVKTNRGASVTAEEIFA